MAAATAWWASCATSRSAQVEDADGLHLAAQIAADAQGPALAADPDLGAVFGVAEHLGSDTFLHVDLDGGTHVIARAAGEAGRREAFAGLAADRIRAWVDWMQSNARIVRLGSDPDGDDALVSPWSPALAWGEISVGVG